VPSGKSLIAAGSKSDAGRRRCLTAHNWIMMFRLIAEVGMSGGGNEMTACLAALAVTSRERERLSNGAVCHCSDITSVIDDDLLS